MKFFPDFMLTGLIFYTFFELLATVVCCMTKPLSLKQLFLKNLNLMKIFNILENVFNTD